jgi:hypothetical protein
VEGAAVIEEIDEDEGWAVYRENGVSRVEPWPPPPPAAPAGPAPPPARASRSRGRWIAAGAAALVAAEVLRRRR